jgi:outer membrane lipoprotein-sorting protein
MASENNNRLDDVLARAIGGEKPEPDFAKWQQEHPQAVQMLKSQATQQPHPRRLLDIGRIIMRSPITKLAVAAVIIIAVLTGIYVITGKPPAVTCCAWAELANRVEQIKTFVFSTHSRQSEGHPKLELDSRQFISSAYGYKMEAFDDDGNLVLQDYLNFNDKTETTVSPKEKEYTHKILTDKEWESVKKLYEDPRHIVTIFMSGTGPFKDIGKDVINGVEVRGIQVVPTGSYHNCVGKIWIDVRTELPVRIEVEGEQDVGSGKLGISRVFDEFEWDTELDPSVFEPNIPADYKVEGSGHEEANTIEGLRSYAELTKGRYPTSMDGDKIAQEIWRLFGEHFNLEEVNELYIGNSVFNIHSDFDISNNGHTLNIHPNPDRIGKVNEQMQHKLQKLSDLLYEPFLFYTQHENEGNTPVYYGDKVTAEFGDSVLMRWKVSHKQYRVIFGNLTVKTVSADELAALEAMPLNRHPKAIKPVPANGAVGGNLGLSWMPGMYSVEHKVYIGTAADKFSLLTDVSGDSNVIVHKLRQDTTYYWRVDGIDANGKVTTGDVWSFNTGKLVGWWKFDESTGTIASDSSGNGNNGMLKGSPVWRPQGGKTGGAIELSGKGDYVEISNEANFDINDQITVSAWVNITDVPQEWTGIVTKGDSAWRLSTSFAKNVFHFGVSSRDYLNGQITVDSGQWHNVVCIYDGQKINIYVDGKLDASMPRIGPIGTNDYPVCIGENIELKGRCFHGLIDDVRIYNYALSENEVVELYNGAH